MITASRLYAFENNFSAGSLGGKRGWLDPEEGIALSAKTCDITTADCHKHRLIMKK